MIRILVIAVAGLAAIVPLSAAAVESWYSRGVYPAIQQTVTPLSNLVPIALLDVAALSLTTILTVVFVRRYLAVGLARALTRSAVTLFTLTALTFLVFLAMWGLNYRRLPLESKLAYDASRVTRESALTLGRHAIGEVNALHATAHAASVAGPTLEQAFAAAEQRLGHRTPTVTGVAKRSLIERYFRAAAIDGMTDPFFLEIIINPDTLPFERPFVLAHEWAHLAGYAKEDEANFVAWLACTEGDPMARYSGWLAIFQHVAVSLPPRDRFALARGLGPGPRRDLDAAAGRYATATPVVRAAAQEVYDGYLRANRVPDGVANYTAVIRLMLGAGLTSGERPTLR
jgi:hypothetical protein